MTISKKTRPQIQAPDHKFLAAVEAIVASCGEGVRDLLTSELSRLAPAVVKSIARCAPERQQYEIDQVRAGRRPFSTKSTVFDTTGYGEVASRLTRAGGTVRKVAAAWAITGPPPDGSAKSRAAEMRADCVRLGQLIRAAFRTSPPGEADECRARVPVGRRVWTAEEFTPSAMARASDDLVRAGTFVAKCVRDLQRLPELPEDRRFLPTAAQAHNCLARLLALIQDLARIGGVPNPGTRVIVTHSRPDTDALVSAWMAERFLFPGEPVAVSFVAYDRVLAADPPADCVLDLGGVHAPELRAFDHKPPAFADRNGTCATRLLWNHLTVLGQPVGYLVDLVAAVHAGDQAPPRRVDAMGRVRRDQTLGGVLAARRVGGGDAQVYSRARAWLDEAYPSPTTPQLKVSDVRLESSGTPHGKG